MAWWYRVKQVFLCMFLFQYFPKNTVNSTTVLHVRIAGLPVKIHRQGMDE